MLQDTSTIISCIAIVLVAAATVGLIYFDYKRSSKPKQRAARKDVHDMVLSSIQIAKELAKTEVINVAKDDNLPTGSMKKDKAVKLIMTYLGKFDFNIPEATIARIVEATYQTYSDFLKEHKIDSRLNSNQTPPPSKPVDLNEE